MLKRAVLAGVMIALCAAAATAQTTVFIVRHAERADNGTGSMGDDPPLSDAGRARAASLAGMLKDTKLTAVFATQFKRTQETAAPTAKAQNLAVTTIPAAQTAALVTKLKAAKGAVLVVGHSDSVRDIVTALGVTPPVTVDEKEFDNLFIVLTGAPPRLVRLRYK